MQRQDTAVGDLMDVIENEDDRFIEQVAGSRRAAATARSAARGPDQGQAHATARCQAARRPTGTGP